MALPTFVSVSAKASGTGAITPALPASMVAGDLVVLVATSISGGSVSITANGSITNWTLILNTDSGIGGSELFTLWVGEFISGSTGPTVTPGSDHCCAATFAYRGVNRGDITKTIQFQASQGTEATVDTSFSWAPGNSSKGNEALVLCICTSGQDSTTGQVPVMANSNLANLNLRANYNTNSGDGGGFGLTDGQLATAGSTGTFSCTLVNASAKAYGCIILHTNYTDGVWVQPQNQPYLTKTKITNSEEVKGGDNI